MAKTLEFEYQGENYTLEYTRRTVKEIENRGFSIRALRDRPMTMYPMLFEGAFLCHHRKVKEEVVNAIYKDMPDKERLAEKLVEMYNSALDTLFDEPEDESKKVEWKTNF